MMYALLLLAALWGALGRPQAAPPCQARLRLSQEAQLLTLTGQCQSLLDEPARYRYQLLVRRRGAGGQSQNTQSGEFALPARQAATLSTVRLQVAPTDSYQARLTIFDAEGRTVAQDSVSQAGSLR
ncbi:curli-like amyloid fiber formation chaperone CsgH [Hymenobacter sp.]|uniref:curli-like amyloid fiber formation chaperone CsgH n=1 Tax=Hymenobacter sp. TaxID=1898978 RepID=UPI002D8075C8|nr:curli-like amyloid fiber formation chaperone CsgH [Hymenobacter sp.]